MVILPTPAMASRALTTRLARIWSIWAGSIFTGQRSLAGLPEQVDILADQAPEHLEHARDGVVEVENLRGDGLLAGEGQKLAGEVGGALGGGSHFVQVLLDRVVWPCSF